MQYGLQPLQLQMSSKGLPSHATQPYFLLECGWPNKVQGQLCKTTMILSKRTHHTVTED